MPGITHHVYEIVHSIKAGFPSHGRHPSPTIVQARTNHGEPGIFAPPPAIQNTLYRLPLHLDAPGSLTVLVYTLCDTMDASQAFLVP